MGGRPNTSRDRILEGLSVAVYMQQVSVTTAATRVDPVFGGFSPEGSCAVRNRGAVAVYLGSAAVTTTTGFQVDPGETFTVDLRSRDALYGVVASGSASCHVIQVSGT